MKGSDEIIVKNWKKKFHKLISTLPSVKSLRIYLKIFEPNIQEYVFYLMIIEILEIYSKTFGFPQYKFYRKDVLPLKLDFYNKITENQLDKIIHKTQEIIMESPYNGYMKINKGKHENIAKCYEEIITYGNLLEGCNKKLFFL